jgi:hypothetical protein
MGRGERSRFVLHISPYRAQGNPVLIGSGPTIKQKLLSKITAADRERPVVGAVHPNHPAIESIAPTGLRPRCFQKFRVYESRFERFN